jgi:transposase-like protein
MTCSLIAHDTPITQIQTTILDYIDGFYSYDELLWKRLEEKEDNTQDSRSCDEFVLLPERLLQLKDPFCKIHKRKLIKNGTNKKTIYTSDGKAIKGLRVQRYRCKRCGEYLPNYGEFIAPHHNYQYEVKQKARRFYHLGNCVRKVKNIFEINGLTVPSETSIRNWVDAATESIEQVIQEVKLPVSGYFGFDEIHIHKNGKKAYVFSLADSHDGFYINAEFSASRKKGAIMDFLARSKRKGKTKFRGMTMDGSNNYGGIFKSQRFHYIKVGRCEMHFKGTLNERIYMMAGLGRSFQKPLPEPYSSLKEDLFRVFDAPNYTEALFQLARTEARFYQKYSLKMDKLIDHTYKLLPNLLRHLKDRQIKNTNNATERMNKDLLQHPSLKHFMKTVKGVNRIVKGKVFLKNFWAFQYYIIRISSYIEHIEQLIAFGINDEDLKREKHSLKIHLAWVKKHYDHYKQIYLQYFKLGHEQFSVE